MSRKVWLGNIEDWTQLSIDDILDSTEGMNQRRRVKRPYVHPLTVSVDKGLIMMDDGLPELFPSFTLLCPLMY